MRALRRLVATLVLLGPLGAGALTAQYQRPWQGRGVTAPSAGVESAARVAAQAVAAVGLTVSDMDRSVDFYTTVLDFEKATDHELTGEAYEKLQGVFGTCQRVVRLRLGEEYLELTEFLAPRGRPAPVDSRSNDHWFQHVAMVLG